MRQHAGYEETACLRMAARNERCQRFRSVRKRLAFLTEWAGATCPFYGCDSGPLSLKMKSREISSHGKFVGFFFE